MVKRQGQNGLGKREISQALSVPHGAATCALKKLKGNGGEVGEAQGSGRPRTITIPSFAKNQGQEARGNSKAPTTEIAAALVSKRSAVRDALGLNVGREFVRAVKSPKLPGSANRRPGSEFAGNC